jgi:hypothetical protein
VVWSLDIVVVHHWETVWTYKAVCKVPLALVGMPSLFCVIYSFGPLEPRICYRRWMEVSSSQADACWRWPGPETTFSCHHCVRISLHEAVGILTHYFSYPLSNAILITPLSIVRWIQNAGSHHISSTDSSAVVAVFDLSGLVNVLLFLVIRPNLLLFRRDTLHCDDCGREELWKL